MKKVVLVLVAFVITTGIFSCKVQHEKCAAYSKINKIETDKTDNVIFNKTLKSI